MTVRLADSIARFSADWRQALSGGRNDPPELGAYVPDESEARLAVLSDLVRIDIRHRWERPGLGKRINEYSNEFPEVEDSPEFVDLLREEFVARRRSEALQVEDFLAEYPELADRVREHLAATGADRMDANVLRIDRALPDIAPGQRIDDFDLLTELGIPRGHHSASSRVFLARQRSMQRLVAVRISTGGRNEPHTMARLDHPHIVRVFDHRIVAFGGDAEFGRLVYMQYLPGGTATEVLEQRRNSSGPTGGRLLLRAIDAAMESKGEIRPADSRVRAEIAELSWPETVAWVGRRLADALDYADRRGVRHQAIKPSNVLFTSEGVPKLADIAHTDSAGGSDFSPRSGVYCSPEELARQLDSEAPEPDTRSDIYSLGLLLWELLTGTLPFEDDARTAVALDHRREGVPSTALERLPADCPAALRRVLLTCLEPDTDRRWSSGAVLAQQFDLCLDAHARDLVDPPRRSVRRHMRHWRVLVIALAIAVPNALASLYNIEHNRKLITAQMTPEAHDRIDFVTAVANIIDFSLGAVLLFYFGRRLILVPHGLRAGTHYSPETLHRTRTDSILLGDRAVLIIFSMWLVSGISFPIGMADVDVHISAYAYVHYFVSHAICGAIALVYPFLLMNFYIIRCIYPMFLSHGEISARDAVLLHRLRRRCGAWMLGAAAIPLLSVAGATLLVPADLAEIIVVLRFLAIGSLVAFLGVYVLFMALEKDLRALGRVLAPEAAAGQVNP
ncbi:protein kinase [Nocardia sp. XZ_19_385]|uniref:protein kinase domain-containing protein n=1 Tax=Nocardia sp. XZ_19_385 TaxID=2769488 RepID=UPI002814D70B|nr:protein kinase [Nocardia sp. XZ_19_385]